MGKYEEALERARQGLPLDEVFPELKESEDERIRRAICVAICSSAAETVLEAHGVKLVFALAYLRKQKEQKPALYWHKIKAYDHLPCKAYIYKFAYEQENNFHGECHIDGFLMPNEPVKIGCDTWYLPVEDIKNLPKEEELDTTSPMKTVEQKPNVELIQKSWYLEGYHDGKYNNEPKWLIQTGKGGPRYKENQKYGTQKPAEWSEEDDVMLDKVCCLINPGTKLTDDNTDYCVELKQWICSLRERILKSIRPQPHWKPSEQQMEALNSIILNGSFTYVSQVQDLISLKDDLKKLM